jgi:hypothetical protein
LLKRNIERQSRPPSEGDGRPQLAERLVMALVDRLAADSEIEVG